jgi:hypothetical protein
MLHSATVPTPEQIYAMSYDILISYDLRCYATLTNRPWHLTFGAKLMPIARLVWRGKLLHEEEAQMAELPFV